MSKLYTIDSIDCRHRANEVLDVVWWKEYNSASQCYEYMFRYKYAVPINSSYQKFGDNAVWIDVRWQQYSDGVFLDALSYTLFDEYGAKSGSVCSGIGLRENGFEANRWKELDVSICKYIANGMRGVSHFRFAESDCKMNGMIGEHIIHVALGIKDKLLNVSILEGV